MSEVNLSHAQLREAFRRCWPKTIHRSAYHAEARSYAVDSSGVVWGLLARGKRDTICIPPVPGLFEAARAVVSGVTRKANGDDLARKSAGAIVAKLDAVQRLLAAAGR